MGPPPSKKIYPLVDLPSFSDGSQLLSVQAQSIRGPLGLYRYVLLSNLTILPCAAISIYYQIRIFLSFLQAAVISSVNKTLSQTSGVLAFRRF